jgi:hypothetical protein
MTGRQTANSTNAAPWRAFRHKDVLRLVDRTLRIDLFRLANVRGLLCT